MLNGTPETNPDLYYHYTPLNLMDEEDPDLMLLHGTLDDLVPIENSEAVNRKAEELSLQCTFLRVYAIGHGFTNNAQYNRFELYYIERFLYAI